MRFNKAFTWIVAFLLVFVAFSVVFTGTSVADDGSDDEFESDNGKALYLQDDQSKEYYYNYTDVAVEKAVDIPYPYDTGNAFSYDTETTLDVLATKVGGKGEHTRVFLYVSAAGGYSYNESESVKHPNDDYPSTAFGHVGNAAQVLEAEITGYDGEIVENSPFLQVETGSNGGTPNITDGYDGGDGGLKIEMEVKTAPELLEALIEEEIGIDDIEEGAELSRAEEGLLIEQERQGSRGKKN